MLEGKFIVFCGSEYVPTILRVPEAVIMFFSFLVPPLTLMRHMLSPSKLNQNSGGCTSNTLVCHSRLWWAALGPPVVFTTMTTSLIIFQVHQEFQSILCTFPIMFPFITLVSAIKNASLFADILTNLHDSENYHFPLLVFPDSSGLNEAAAFTAHSQNTLQWHPCPCFVFYWLFVRSLPPWRIGTPQG